MALPIAGIARSPERKGAIVKQVTEKDPALGVKLKSLIADIDAAEPHWKTLLEKEQQQRQPDAGEIKAAGTGGARGTAVKPADILPSIVSGENTESLNFQNILLRRTWRAYGMICTLPARK